MRYLATIYVDEAVYAGMGEEEGKQEMDRYEAFGREANEAGVILAGEGLQPVETATTVRLRDGQRLVTDGPFAETKEQLGGFYLFECPSLDEAIEWAAKIPGARHGSVEVRPVMDYEPLGYTEHRAAEATA